MNRPCFQGTFKDMKNLTSIPPDLFINNKKAKTFYYTFAGTGITSIPEGLFDSASEVVNFSRTFNNTKLTSIPTDLFAKNQKVVTFEESFLNVSSLTDALPNLWETHPTAVGLSCFNGATEASNYTSVPIGWK